MRASKLFLITTALAATVAVGACSRTSGDSGDTAGSSAEGGGGARAQGDVAAAPANGGRAAASSAPATVTGNASSAKLASTAKIRIAELTVAVDKPSRIAQQADRAENIALRAGGEVDADDRSGGKNASATVRLRVPPEQLRTVVTALSKLGTERSRSSSTTDVTEKVADVDARLTSARATLTRLRALYADASKVSDVLAVESELSDRQADLESLEAQQRALSRQTSLATVTLFLETAHRTSTNDDKDKYAGFVGGLRRGWDAFVSAVRGVGAAFGAALPFLIVLLLLALAARPVLRRFPPRRRAGSPPVAE